MLKSFCKIFTAALILAAVAFTGRAFATETAKLTIINNSGKGIVYEDKPVTQNRPLTIEIEMPDLEANEGYLCFEFIDGAYQLGTCFTTVRANETFWQTLKAAKTLQLTFFDENAVTYAILTPGAEPEASLKYVYHDILQDWGLMETPYGITVYQDVGDQAEWDAMVAAGENNVEWHTKWEHLYPGEMDDWLRSPLEARFFIVPLTAIYNVNTWSHDDTGSFQLVKLAPQWDEVTSEQLLVLKTFGDFGWALLTYQNVDGQWFFVEHGYDGWGAYGGMWYRIYDKLPEHIKAGATPLHP